MRVVGMVGHLARRLHQISTQVVITRAREAGFEITPVQFAALDALKANPGIDQASLASLIATDRATIGGVVDRLVAKDLITRITSNRDRRARELHLSSEGVRVHAALVPVAEAAHCEIVRGLGKSEQDMLLHLLRKAIVAAEPGTTLDAVDV